MILCSKIAHFLRSNCGIAASGNCGKTAGNYSFAVDSLRFAVTSTLHFNCLIALPKTAALRRKPRMTELRFFAAANAVCNFLFLRTLALIINEIAG